MSLASWQWDNFADLKDKQLNRIILPESHNSGSYNLDMNINIPNYHSCIIRFVQKLMFFSSFLANWSICQDQTIYNQLKMGIRSFDWRVTKINDTYRLHHTFVGSDLNSYLNEYVRFFKEHPNEFIVIRVQKDLYGSGYWKDISKHKEFRKLVYNTYKITYDELRKKNKNIIFVNRNDFKKSYIEKDYINIDTALKRAESWLLNEVPHFDKDDYITYNTNITPSPYDFFSSFLSYSNPLYLIICLYILINRCYKKKNIIKIISNPVNILLVIMIGILVLNYKFSYGLDSREPNNQNRMIDVLKKNKNYIQYITSVSMDFPTDKNIRWVINQNFQQDKY